MKNRTEYSTEEKQELQKERRFRFDGRITLGNLFTIVSFILMMVAAWRNMETRLVLVEERIHAQTEAVMRIENKLDDMASYRRGRPFNNP